MKTSTDRARPVRNFRIVMCIYYRKLVWLALTLAYSVDRILGHSACALCFLAQKLVNVQGGSWMLHIQDKTLPASTLSCGTSTAQTPSSSCLPLYKKVLLQRHTSGIWIHQSRAMTAHSKVRTKQWKRMAYNVLLWFLEKMQKNVGPAIYVIVIHNISLLRY
jgi:hypothetical protein